MLLLGRSLVLCVKYIGVVGLCTIHERAQTLTETLYALIIKPVGRKMGVSLQFPPFEASFQARFEQKLGEVDSGKLGQIELAVVRERGEVVLSILLPATVEEVEAMLRSLAQALGYQLEAMVVPYDSLPVRVKYLGREDEQSQHIALRMPAELTVQAYWDAILSLQLWIKSFNLANQPLYKVMICWRQQVQYAPLRLSRQAMEAWAELLGFGLTIETGALTSEDYTDLARMTALTAPQY